VFFQIVQPQADDLHWIQIEDFVDIFNRVYVTTDFTFEKEGQVKRFVSKWVPGDFIGGSGGPPIMIGVQIQEAEAAAAAEEDDKGAGAGGKSGEVSAKKSSKKEKGGDSDDEGDEEEENGKKSKKREKEKEGSDKKKPKEEPKIVERYAYINDNFTDNPMYPFAVSEPTMLAVSLYQKDLRWNMGRMGDNPKEVFAKTFASRGQRLQACLEYGTGIAFVVVRLSGLKVRLTEFKLRKIAATCENVVFSNVATNLINLPLPGRYAIIPYTHAPLSRAMEYVLICNYKASQVEFEIEDVLGQRLVDDVPSDEEDDEEFLPDDNDLLHLNDDSDDVSIMSFERVKVRRNEDGEFGLDLEEEDEEDDEDDDDDGDADNLGLKAKRRAAAVSAAPPPKVRLYQKWEYAEDTEELGLSQVFGEVGDVMTYVKTLRGEVRKLHATIRALQPSGTKTSGGTAATATAAAATAAAAAAASGAGPAAPATEATAPTIGESNVEGNQGEGVPATKILNTNKRY
jgi:hypothetical protein